MIKKWYTFGEMKGEDLNYKTTFNIPGFLVFIIAFVVVLGGVLLIDRGSSQVQNTEAVATPDTTNLKIVDEKVGTGEEAVNGKKVTVNYVGTLTDGKKFDSSYDRKAPFSFTLGVGEVIQGWDIGVAGMKVGGKRKLTIPPELGYGSSGAGDAIPANATLIFEVELLKVE